MKREKKWLAVIIRIIVIVLIVTCVFIPYESSFIRFDSAEASVNYSTLNYNAPTKTVETDKTAFTVSHRENNWSYHTITKYNDKYGFCDRHSQTVLGLTHVDINDENFRGSFHVSKLVNYETNEKCYIISYINLLDLENKDTEDICIDDEQNIPIEKITFPDKRSVFMVVMHQIDEKITFMINDQKYELN